MTLGFRASATDDLYTHQQLFHTKKPIKHRHRNALSDYTLMQVRAMFCHAKLGKT